MGPLGVPELIFLFVLALLILGPKKLPELGRSIGKGMAEFRRASNELRYTFEREMHNLERENQEFKKDVTEAASSIASSTSMSSSSYDYPTDDYSYSYESTPSVSAPQAAENQPTEGTEVKTEVKTEAKS